MTMGGTSLRPRVTSAIVSSTFEEGKMVMTSNEPKVYVLDKALNYGNSGGPILSSETGRAHAFCSRFQPVWIPQHEDAEGKVPAMPFVMIPSLYGVVVSLENPEIQSLLEQLKVPLSDD